MIKCIYNILILLSDLPGIVHCLIIDPSVSIYNSLSLADSSYFFLKYKIIFKVYYMLKISH
jgi:hypothetical protein